MQISECHREAEVVEAISLDRWPSQSDPELRSHVASCAVCSDVVTVASALQEDNSAIVSEVRVPSAGLVWWRAELRARREAVRAVERPLTVVHAFAGAAAIGVLFAVLIQMSSFFVQTFATLAGWMPESPVAILQQHLPLVLTLSALLVLTSVALYFVLSDK